MADISKCSNTKCTIKENCYRFTSQSNIRQSYGDFTQDSDGKCEYYMNNNKIKIENNEQEK